MTFARGYLTNILNLEPAIFYVAAFPQLLLAHQLGFYSTGALLGLTHVAIASVLLEGRLLVTRSSA